MTRRRISQTLTAGDGHLRCGSCDHALAPVNGPWKQAAALSERTVASLPGAGLGTDPTVMLRQFCCPACGALLDTETALPDDPFLDDVVVVRDGAP
jgi:acetone carboxylase gamma subunit